MRRVLSVILVAFGLQVASSQAAELGRVPVREGAKGERVEVIKDYSGAMSETGPGFDILLAWNSLDFDIGDADFSDETWSPQASFTYGIGTMFDLRFTAKYLQGSDDDVDMTAIRLGVGTRAWFKLKSDFQPYIGGHLNYYVVDIDQGGSNDGMFGVEAEGGLAYLINEFWAVHLGLFYEASVTDGSTTIGGAEQDVTLSALGVGLGFNVVF
jgi:hypothetical protein